MQKSIREHSATMHSEMDETIAIENQDPFVRWRFDSTSMEVNDNENLANVDLVHPIAPSAKCAGGPPSRMPSTALLDDWKPGMGDQAMMMTNTSRLERLDVPCIPLVRQRNSGEPVTDPAQFLAGIVRRQRMQMRRAEQQRVRQEQDQHRKDQLMQQRRRDDHAKSNPVTESENGLKFAPIQAFSESPYQLSAVSVPQFHLRRTLSQERRPQAQKRQAIMQSGRAVAATRIMNASIVGCKRPRTQEPHSPTAPL